MYKKLKPADKSSIDITRNNYPLRTLPDNVDRKCATPSLFKQSKDSAPKSISVKTSGSLSKQRNKSTERQITVLTYNKKHSQRNIVDNSFAVMAKNFERKKTNQINRFKNRPVSNLASRHAKHLESHLNHLNESVLRTESKLDQQNLLRIKDVSFHNLYKHNNKQLNSLLNEGRKHLRNNNFEKAADSFKESLKFDGEELETLYLLAICKFHLGQYHESIKYFNSILIRDDTYKKNIYFFLSIAYKRINDNNMAIQVLSTAISKLPKYYDVILFRGKLLTKQKKHYEAIEDFNRCIKLCPDKPQAYVCKADSMKVLMQHAEAAELYTKSLVYERDYSVMLKRAVIYIEMDKVAEAKQDLQEINRFDPTNSQAYLFKGLIFYKTGNYNDAILSYEQAIKHNSSKKAITKCLYEIAKIKIELRDYYGANYTLQRAESLDVDMKILEKIKMFTDGVTFLMKNKYKPGVEILTNIISKQNIQDYLKPLVYSFRCYGYFCLKRFTHALSDLQTMEKMKLSMDEASLYNKQLLEGIVHTQNHKFDEAVKRFENAEKLKPNSSDPFIYKGLLQVTMHNKAIQTNSTSSTINLIRAAEFISNALDKQENNYNAYFLRATIYHTLGKQKLALEDVEKAIDKSDDHVIKHFYLRALIYAALDMFKQALGDFSNVISLMKDIKDKEQSQQKQMPEAYMYRAKCYLMFGQKKRAFQDLQKYTSYNPQDPQIHHLTGQLLFSIGASEEAVKAYSQNNIEKNNTLLLERAKCYLLLKQLNLCLKDMQRIVQNGDNTMLFDYGCLEALREASKKEKQNFEKALKKIKSVKTIVKGDGYIFERADYHFYKGVFYFYLENYQKCLNNFLKCKREKAAARRLEQLLNTGQSQAQQIYENKILTLDQLNYNIGLVHLLLGNEMEAKGLLQQYPEFVQSQIPEDQTQITPFPISNRLCSIFSPIEIRKNILCRLSFCLPQVNPPQLDLSISENVIVNISMYNTEARPDGPWIKRNSYGVVFTQEVVGCDVDLNTEIQPSQKSNRIGQSDNIQENANKCSEFQRYLEEDPIEQINQERMRMKNLLTLDPATELKLSKLMKK